MRSAALNYEKLLPIVPFVGTAIAVTFDVGYFSGININYFTFFSLVEHISFALEALPIAVVILLVVAIVDSLTEWKMRPSQEEKPIASDNNSTIEQIQAEIDELRAETKVILRRLLINRLVTFGFLVGALAYFWFFGFMRNFAFFCAIWLVVASARFAPKRWYNSAPASIFLLGIVAAFLIGESIGSSYVTSNTSTELIILKSSEAPLPVKIIRAGERGVLFVRPEPKTIEFARWDDIKTVSSKAKESIFDRK